MRKINYLSAFAILFLFACSTGIVPPLGGGYQSEMVEGSVVFVGIQPDDKSFVEYIDNREVDRGFYEKQADDCYLFKSDKQTFEITLSEADSFKVHIPRLNDGKEIELKNLTKTPSYFKTKFDDVKEYEKLLEEK